MMFGGCPEWGEFSPLPHYLRLELTDTGDGCGCSWGGSAAPTRATAPTTTRTTSTWCDDPGVDPDAVISAPAGVLDARLWRRGDGDAIHLAGDLEIVDHFRRVIHQPIN